VSAAEGQASRPAPRHIDPVGPQSYVRPPRSRPEKYENLAFTFCRMGTVGLIAWILSPAVFVLVVSVIAIVLYAKSITLGVSWTKCFLRRPTLIVGFWGVVAVADAYWLFVLGSRLPI
jgi:hypothetical protein